MRQFIEDTFLVDRFIINEDIKHTGILPYFDKAYKKTRYHIGYMHEIFLLYADIKISLN
jgi:hypothetical protein